jgi:hypothetical protein
MLMPSTTSPFFTKKDFPLMLTKAVEMPVVLFLTKPQYFISVNGFTTATLGTLTGIVFGVALE